jgi:glutathione S-transferase
MGKCQSTLEADQTIDVPYVPSDDPVLYYMPIAARGEVSRLVAHCGGLTLKFETECPDVVKKEAGSPSSTPILVHGPLKISQSLAIVSYLVRIAPKYQNHTPAQQAKDVHMVAIVDDVIQGLAKVLFDPRMKSEPSFAGPAITEHADKWMPVIEAILPSSGFVNGLDYPTAADFALLVMIEGQTPFVGCWKMANYDPFKSAPKLKGLVERTKADEQVKVWLALTETMAGNPFGLPS